MKANLPLWPEDRGSKIVSLDERRKWRRSNEEFGELLNEMRHEVAERMHQMDLELADIDQALADHRSECWQYGERVRGKWYDAKMKERRELKAKHKRHYEVWKEIIVCEGLMNEMIHRGDPADNRQFRV